MDDINKLIRTTARILRSKQGETQIMMYWILSSLAQSTGGGRGKYMTTHGEVPISITARRDDLNVQHNDGPCGIDVTDRTEQR